MIRQSLVASAGDLDAVLGRSGGASGMSEYLQDAADGDGEDMSLTFKQLASRPPSTRPALPAPWLAPCTGWPAGRPSAAPAHPPARGA